MSEQHWIIKVKGQIRECRYDLSSSRYVHVLNSGWSIYEFDPEIDEVKACGTPPKGT